MAAERIDWAAAAAAGDRIVFGVLLAGCDDLLLPDGVTISSAVWTGAQDPAWHVTGTSGKPWLAWDSLTIEERVRPVEGGLDVSSLTLRLADVDGAVTAFLASRESMPTVLLAADLTASATTITVQTTAAFASSGVLHIGRERITYSGKTGTTFTGCTRGTAGTRARSYKRVQRQRVYGGDKLPSTLGRRVTVWALRFASADATQVTDPTLIYDGRVGEGTRMSDAGAIWEIPIDHAIKALGEKSPPITVTLYGYAHYTANLRSTTASRSAAVYAVRSPLQAWWYTVSSGVGLFCGLSQDATAPDDGGWHPTREVFLEKWNTAARALGSVAATDSVPAGGVDAYSASARRLEVQVAWWGRNGGINAAPLDPGSDTTTAHLGIPTMPEACLWLEGLVHLDDADLAVIPSTPAASGDVLTQWALACERDNGILPKEELRATITVTGGGASTIEAAPIGVERYTPGGAGGELTAGAAALITRATIASLRLSVDVGARASGWWNAIRYGLLAAIDEARGLDHIDDSMAWARIATIAAGAQPWNVARRYWIDPAEPPIATLRNEALLSGLSLATHRGRIAVARIRDVGSTEAPTRTLAQSDLRRGAVATMREVSDGIISSVRCILPGSGDEERRSVSVVDASAVAESGVGAEIVARVPEGAIGGIGGVGAILADSRLRGSVERVALSMLSPWVRPYRLVTVPTDLRCAGVEIGDVIDLDEWLLPNGSGARGISQRAVVIGHRRDYRAGRVDLFLRVSEVRAGWCPAFLLASISGAVCTVDADPCGTSSAAGFASESDADGNARTDAGLEYLATGDEVRIVELDARSPATAFDATVSSVDRGALTVTLNASPGATWATRATNGVALMVPAKHTTAVAAQRRYVFVADGATFLLSDSSPAKVWA